MMFRLNPIMCLAFCFMSGCQTDPWAFEYARSKPTQSIAGVYKPTSRTYSFLDGAYKNVRPSRLELHSDGSFLIKDIAAIWSPFSVAGGFEQVQGHWSLGKHQDWWAVNLFVDQVKSADGRLIQSKSSMPIMLIGQQAPYKLHFGIGDPDTGEALQYEKQ
ncbi:hypothetical protein LRS06_04480 [Hymenobacter sp. J193]|uniref:hypothetical protein n=1 Tax=Hymenobacter sp. J193 TaxID=2898429 RepID=UPI0021518C73|nr:hypothetical protein [Hymenobacter sp. J193]MCR5887044.1 hypothetical protein [Hymenobacter sp. J193]